MCYNGIPKQEAKKMLAVNYSTIRNNLKDYCDKASDEGEVIIVTRKEEKNVVILGMDEYNRLQKQAANAKYINMLDKSMEQIKDGGIVVKDVKDFED